ncbi:hypothetical protein RUM44_007666 [Polyplax serrata]|uniref:Uncharacterized protein n=1 Tax=Polyplax serrata TaxID=468196 RepID=A0ABR1BA57_POLSC
MRNKKRGKNMLNRTCIKQCRMTLTKDSNEFEYLNSAFVPPNLDRDIVKVTDKAKQEAPDGQLGRGFPQYLKDNLEKQT